MRSPLFVVLTVLLVVNSHAALGAKLEGAAVAAPDAYSVKVAAGVLSAGGNAVDAAVATAFTLAVTYPEAGNIGGGGFMTLYMDGKPYFLDYREVAPKAASKRMYLDDKGEVIENLSLVGAKAAGVPGTVLGLWDAHRRFGTLPWSELITPAIGYAREGFEVADQQFQYREDAIGLFNGTTNFEAYFGDMRPGINFQQPELAKTLERIADQGADDFYKGKTADLLVAQMQRDGGLITKDDLADYRTQWREPMRIDWRGKSLYTAPLPSSGGIALAQLIGIKEQRAADFKGVELNSARYIHLLAEIEKRVFADRADYLGDPDFSDVPVAHLTSPDYLARRAREINPTAIWGCKPETQKFPSADQHGLSRAWSMSSCIARMTSSWVYDLALGSSASRRASSTSRVIRAYSSGHSACSMRSDACPSRCSRPNSRMSLVATTCSRIRSWITSQARCASGVAVPS